MTNTGIMLMLVIFLTGTAMVAGFGIGLVVGLVLGGREPRDPEEKTSAPVPGPLHPVDTSGVEKPALEAGKDVWVPPETAAASAKPRAQWWSVALALAVIAICCICTFLAAAIVTALR